MDEEPSECLWFKEEQRKMSATGYLTRQADETPYRQRRITSHLLVPIITLIILLFVGGKIQRLESSDLRG